MIKWGLVLLMASATTFGCKSAKDINTSYSDLDQLARMMAGHYNSAEQAAQDSQFYDISLTMVPIWEDDNEARWLYVEQSVTATIKQPYRQRVYRLTEDGGLYESKVYDIVGPDRFIHLWEDRTKEKLLKNGLLVEREGCSVFLKAEGNCFKGATKKGSCKSTLRGAAYATSIVELCEDEIVSWDQGWNAEGEQVWGAVKGGYIFKKVNK